VARPPEADLPLFREKRVNDPEKALKLLRVEARSCTRCDLYKNATQTVFGEGPADASLMLIGEQPGDQEDLAGLPFVGPAGKVLDKALEAAGIERNEVYITNAVKHFKNEPRGKRRLHKKPDTSEIDACRWWLDNEIDFVQPAVARSWRHRGARADAQATVHQCQSRTADRTAWRCAGSHHRSSLIFAEAPRGARQAARVRTPGQRFAHSERCSPTCQALVV